jgi:hypothetical protein
MTAVTLEAIEAKQTELAAMIQQLQKQAVQTRVIEIESCDIELAPGEHYAGVVLDEDGQHQHHLVLMAQRPTNKLNWQAATDWAKSVGGYLPFRQEQALLYANCKAHLQSEWHWSCETHKEDASSAWFCNFSYGNQFNNHNSYEGCAVAVRRV